MNRIKSIVNTNIPRRVPSNIRITHRSIYKYEASIKKRPIKPRSPKIGSSFMLAMRQIHPSLVKVRYEGIRIGDACDQRGMLYGQSGIRSKSIASLVKKFLSERKLLLQCNFVKNVSKKQEMMYSNSSSPCYDYNINYEGDREARSYAQMITAYNNTMMMVDNAPDMIQDKLKSKVRLSKTLFRTNSILSSPAYNFENLTLKDNTKETSMTDLSVDTSFNHSISEIDNDFYEKDEKRKDLEICESKVMKPETTTRSYANIIADYSAAMNSDLISNKSENYFSKLSMVSSSSEKVITPERSEFVLSPNLSTDSRKNININAEIDWLTKVDKVIKDLKSATEGKDKKIDKNVLEERNVLQCVTVDKTAKVEEMKSMETTPRKTYFPGDNKNEEVLKHCKGKTSYKAEKIDGIQMVGQCLSSDYKISTSPNVNSIFKKNLTQMPRNTESNISNDPQVELRMVPSGNESVVSINVEAIAKTTEPRNLNSKELSVVVSSNNKQTLSNALPINLRGANQSNFGSMRISISEGSLPVKELELFINGKPISDVRSIKARTETLNVFTSMDKVEIRVPYDQDNPNTLNQSPKNFVKNISNSESVLKLKIATAFDETNPIITSGNTKKVQQIPTDPESKSLKMKSTRTEESNFNVIMSELSSTIKNKDESNIQEMSGIKIQKSDEVGVKKTFKHDTNQEKHEQPIWIKREKDSLKRPNVSLFTSISDDIKKHEINDIDLRLTKIFGSKSKIKNNSNVKQDEFIKSENVPSSGEKSVGNEPFKLANLKSVSSEMNTDKSSNMTDKVDIKKTLTSKKTNVRSLADIMIKHSNRSSDGNSSAISGKPIPNSNQINDQKSPKSDKHDSKTIDVITKKFILNNQSSKIDSLDERVSLKQSPRLSDTKSKKEEDYQRNYSTPTYVTDKQKATQSNRTLDSNDKIQSKLKEDSLEEKKSSTKWNKPSIEMKSSKGEKQNDIKDSKTFSKVRDVEKTSKSSSTFKSENVQTTRDDFFLSNEKTTSRSSSNPVKIVEEKLNKRNEVSFKGEAKNVGTSMEAESMKKTGLMTEKKDNVKIQMKELPKSNVVMKNTDLKINENQQNVDNVRNEKFIRSKLISSEESMKKIVADEKRGLMTEKKDNVKIQMNELPKSNVVMKNTDLKINENQQNVDNVRNEKFIRSKLISSEESMKKTIADEKHGLMIEKKDNVKIQMKELPKSNVVMKNTDLKINENQQNVDNVRNEKFIRSKLTSSEEKSNIQTNDTKDLLNDSEKQRKSTNDLKDTKMKNIFNSMKPIEKKKDGILIDYGVKVASRKKQEKTKSPIKDVTTNEIVKENNSIVTSTNEKVTEKENQCLNNRDEIKTIQSIPVSKENSIKNNPKELEFKVMKKVTNESKSLESNDAKEKNLSHIKKDVDSKVVNSDKINNESLSERLSKTLDKLKENLSYQNVYEFRGSNSSINSSTTNSVDKLYPSAKEESTKTKNVTTVKSSDEEFRVPYEGTVVQNPSKSSSTGDPNTVMEPLVGTIVRCPSKESDKKRSKKIPYKKNTRENSNKTEKQKEHSHSVNLLEKDTNQNKSDYSGCKNNSGKSNPVNSNDPSSFKKTKSYSTTSTNLIKSNKPDCKENNKQNNVKTEDEFVNKLKRPDKDLVYSVWLQRTEGTADDKRS